MAETARAIIRYRYESQTGTSFNSVVLVRDVNRVIATRNGQLEMVALPGGTLQRGEKPELRVRKELEEELGADVLNLQQKGSVTSSASGITHHLFDAEIRGRGNGASLIPNYECLANPNKPPEIAGFAFLNSGEHNRIPSRLLEGHVIEYLKRYGQELRRTLTWDPRKQPTFTITSADLNKWRRYIRRAR